MHKRNHLWARLEDGGTSGAFWAVCNSGDKDATLFVQCNSGHGWEKYGELRKYAKLDPFDIRAFYNDEKRWEAATPEAQAQYYEFMADVVRMFAPKGV